MQGVVWECIAWSHGVGGVRCVWLAKKAQPRQRGLLSVAGLLGYALGCAYKRGQKAKKSLAAMDPWLSFGLTGCWALQTFWSRPGVHAKPLTQGKPWEWCGGYRQGLAFLGRAR